PGARGGGGAQGGRLSGRTRQRETAAAQAGRYSDRRSTGPGLADGARGQACPQWLAPQQGAAAAARSSDAQKGDPGPRGRGRRRLFRHFPPPGLRGDRWGRRAENFRVLLPLLALQSTRCRGSDRWPHHSCVACASAQDRGRQTRGGKVVTLAARHRAGLRRPLESIAARKSQIALSGRATKRTGRIETLVTKD